MGEGFHAAKQAQPHYPTDDSPVRMATTKRPFVVERMQARQAELLPGLEQMSTGRGTGLVEVLGQTNGLREQLERVKVLNLRATPDVLGNDVGGLHRIDVPHRQPGVIRHFGRRTHGMGQFVACENTLNRRFARQRFDLQFDQLAPYRSCANQTMIGRLEGVPQRDHQPLQCWRCNRPDRQRRTRVIGKVGMRLVPEFRPPFVELSGRPLQILTYISSWLSAQATTNGFAPQCLFARVHRDASSLREEGHTKRARCYDCSRPLECARCRDCSNAHDVVTIERYYEGTLLIGVSAGAVQLGLFGLVEVEII
jgi:hypothetical protein